MKIHDSLLMQQIWPHADANLICNNLYLRTDGGMMAAVDAAYFLVLRKTAHGTSVGTFINKIN